MGTKKNSRKKKDKVITVLEGRNKGKEQQGHLKGVYKERTEEQKQKSVKVISSLIHTNGVNSLLIP